MASIVPVLSIHDAPQLFDLVPLYTLPSVDMSCTIESYWFNSPRLRQFIKYATENTPPFACYLISTTGTAIVFVVPARIGRVVAVGSCLLGIPMIVSAVAQLRWDFMKLLMRTYDAWFFTFIATASFIVIGMLLNDLRAIQMISCWATVVHEVFIDSNVNSPRRLWIANCFEVVMMLVVAVCASLGLMDSMHAFNIVRYNDHVLPATAFAHDGMLTILVVMARNIVRRYQALVLVESSLVKCVGFRCRLRFKASSRLGCGSRETTTAPLDGNLAQMRFEPSLDPIDPHDTLLHSRLRKISSTGQLPVVARIAFNCMGLFGFVTPYVIIGLGLASPQHVQRVDVYILWCAALLSSIFFIGVTFACSQRKLLRSIFTSFDFALITTQSSVVHLILADFYGWHGANTASLTISWIWAVWILCWDAITPPYRTLFGLSVRFPAFVGGGLIATVVAVVIAIIFVLPPTKVNDRVLWSSSVWGIPFEFRSLSLLCSMLGTISSWSLRVIWHMCVASENDLVLLDGLVVYDKASRSESRGNYDKAAAT